jgi:hypothetical protein
VKQARKSQACCRRCVSGAGQLNASDYAQQANCRCETALHLRSASECCTAPVRTGQGPCSPLPVRCRCLAAAVATAQDSRLTQCNAAIGVRRMYCRCQQAPGCSYSYVRSHPFGCWPALQHLRRLPVDRVTPPRGDSAGPPVLTKARSCGSSACYDGRMACANAFEDVSPAERPRSLPRQGCRPGDCRRWLRTQPLAHRPLKGCWALQHGMHTPLASCDGPEC